MISATCYDTYGETLESLYQWDCNRKVKIEGFTPQEGADVYFHFTNRRYKKALVLQAVKDEAGYISDIPNELLMDPDTIYVYIYERVGSAPESRTIAEVRLPVYPRQKPDDYIYEQTSSVLVATDLLYEDGILYLVSGSTKIGAGTKVSAGGTPTPVSASLSADTVSASLVATGGEYEEVLDT